MTLLEMGITGAVLTAVVTVLRTLFLHRLPKRALLLLWWMALARFLLPFSIPSPASIYSLLGTSSSVVFQTRAEPVSALPDLSAVSEAPPVREPEAPPVPSLPLLPLLWAAGSAGCALHFTIAAVRCGREFRMSLPVSDPAPRRWLEAHPLRRRVQVRASDRVSAPLTYGIFRPVILVPGTFDFQDDGLTDSVLTHEWVHITRFDGLAKRLIIAAACLHWWNPMAWGLYVLFSRDLELACDEAVVRLRGVQSRGAYARALLTMEERKSGLAPFCSGFNQNAMEERILAIMKTKPLTKRAAAASAAGVFAVGLLFATSAQAADPSARTAEAGGTEPAETYVYPVSSVDWDEERELLESFQEHGISYDSGGKMYFQGKRVRWFWDGYEIWEDGSLLGWSMRYEYLDKDGTVDVRTLHAAIDNGDGSFDYYGPLTDIVAYSQEEFDSRTYEELRQRQVPATSSDAVLVEDAAHPGTEDASAFSEKIGIVTIEEPAPATGSAPEKSYVMEEIEVSAEGTAVVTCDGGSAEQGRTFAEIFADYAAYGITYREKDGVRELFWNGEPVAQFTDLRPDGGVFSFCPTGGAFSILAVRTVYDQDGKLTGIASAGQGYRQQLGRPGRD